jgi:hypothetical protein
MPQRSIEQSLSGSFYSGEGFSVFSRYRAKGPYDKGRSGYLEVLASLVSSSRRSCDCYKFVSDQASTADQGAVNARSTEQRGRVIGYDAASVLD